MGVEIQDLQERLSKSQIENMELLKALQAATVENGHSSAEPKILKWRKGTDAPCAMTHSSDAVVCGSFVYVCPSTERQLYVYNWEADTWTELLPSPTTHCTLANVQERFSRDRRFPSEWDEDEQTLQPLHGRFELQVAGSVPSHANHSRPALLRPATGTTSWWLEALASRTSRQWRC